MLALTLGYSLAVFYAVGSDPEWCRGDVEIINPTWLDGENFTHVAITMIRWSQFLVAGMDLSW